MSASAGRGEARTRWMVRGDRHPEGGNAALTVQVRDDGRVALLLVGEGRATAVLDGEAVTRAAEALAEVREVLDDRPRPRVARPVAAPEDGRGPALIGGRVVVAEEVHRLLCGFFTSPIRLEGYANVAPCGGCGLAVRLAASAVPPVLVAEPAGTGFGGRGWGAA